MSRRGRRNKDADMNIGMVLWGVIIAIAIIAFIVSYSLYSNRMENQAKTMKNNNTEKISSVTQNDMMNLIGNTEAASSSIGKSVNELEIVNENTDKIAINTSNIEKKQNEKKQDKSEPIEENVSDTEPNVQTEVNVKNPSFARPVEGEIIKDYSKDNLVYSSTLDEWTTHLGIDFASQKTDVVKSSADGKIKSIKNDPRYGLTVVIEHDNGFETIYSSLLTAEFISVGEEVKQGQTIATVGNTARFEVADETHLHFEIKKDGENVDPNMYLK